MVRLSKRVFHLLLFLLTLVGRGEASEKERFYRHIDSKHDFSLEVPSKWRVVTHPVAAFVAVGPPSVGLLRPSVNVLVDHVDPALTLLEVVSTSLSHAQFSLSNFRLLEAFPIEQNGVPGMELVYLCRMQSAGQPLWVKSVVRCLLKNHVFYLLTCSCSFPEFVLYFPLFQRITSSFR